jgi:hypothetical protein
VWFKIDRGMRSMVNRSSGTPGFRISRLSTLSTLPECQVSGLQDLLPRILSRSMTRISFTTPGFRDFPRTSPQISQSAKIPEVLSFLHVSPPNQWWRLTLAFRSSRLKKPATQILWSTKSPNLGILHHMSTIING